MPSQLTPAGIEQRMRRCRLLRHRCSLFELDPSDVPLFAGAEGGIPSQSCLFASVPVLLTPLPPRGGTNEPRSTTTVRPHPSPTPPAMPPFCRLGGAKQRRSGRSKHTRGGRARGAWRKGRQEDGGGGGGEGESCRGRAHGPHPDKDQESQGKAREVRACLPYFLPLGSHYVGRYLVRFSFLLFDPCRMRRPSSAGPNRCRGLRLLFTSLSVSPRLHLPFAPRCLASVPSL